MITITDTAATKVKDLIAQEGDESLMLRVAVRPGGCSGFSYEMFFDSDVASDDLTAEHAGVRVVWVADPEKLTVTEYRVTQPPRQFGPDDVLTIDDIIPGFKLRVRDGF